MRIIGDVHGNYSDYLNGISNVSSSVQLGDFGFDYSCLNVIDGSKHKIIPGNHDNYDQIGFWPNHIFQNNFGIFELGGIRFGYIRGANSVDKQWRIEGKSWWRNEEMTYQDGMKCIHFFRKYHPDIILSHDCPAIVIPLVKTNDAKLIGSITNDIMNEVFDVAPPNFWIFGHHHQDKSIFVKSTVFRCLNELSYVDI